MSLESYFSGKGAPKYLQALADCMKTIGSPEFNAAFLAVIESVIKADQCMIFSYRDVRPECYLSYTRRHKKTATNLAQKYLREGFRDDPLRPIIHEVRITGETRIINFSEIRALMPRDYFDTFFGSRGIGDKISIISSGKSETLVLSFYRFEENGDFVVSDDALRLPFWEVISQMAQLHFSDPDSMELKNPLNSLSAREKDICEAMLNGLTSDAIAWRLDISANTVKTYRQRAYAKLGINSKTALFALCKCP